MGGVPGVETGARPCMQLAVLLWAVGGGGRLARGGGRGHVHARALVLPHQLRAPLLITHIHVMDNSETSHMQQILYTHFW